MPSLTDSPSAGIVMTVPAPLDAAGAAGGGVGAGAATGAGATGAATGAAATGAAALSPD